MVSTELLIGAGVVGIVSAGLVFLHALGVILPRLDSFSLRASGSRLRIPSNRVTAILFMLISLAIPLLAALISFAVVFDANTFVEGATIPGIVATPLFVVVPYLLAINMFLANAEYLLLDYSRETVCVRPSGILGFLPLTTMINLDEIENYRDGHRTVISSTRETGISSYTTHTLVISGKFGARDLEFGSAATRDFAIRALAQRAR